MAGGSVVRPIETAKSKRGYTVKTGLSHCPKERSEQFRKTTPEEHMELYKLMTGKYDRGDEE